MSSIAIDARKYFDFGIGTYIQQVVNHMAPLHPAHEFRLYVSKEDGQRIVPPQGWKKSIVPYKKYSLGEIAAMGFKSRNNGVDLFHAPHYTLPMGLNRRSVVTIHDLIHLRFPRTFSIAQRTYARAMLAHAVHNSGKIIVDSNFTKHDLLQTFRVREDKIAVIHLGVDERYRAAKDEKAVKNFRERFHLDRPFVLFVGNLKPHKGIATLLDAFAASPPLSKYVDLVLVGSSPNHEAKISDQIERLHLQDTIRSLGRLHEKDLLLVYQAADVLVLPSVYEGFGLPALEAMACGTPVIVSDAGSLPEIVGDAAAIFSTGNSQELHDTLQDVLRDASVRKKMSVAGKERARMFSWDSTARKTLEVYESIL